MSSAECAAYIVDGGDGHQVGLHHENNARNIERGFVWVRALLCGVVWTPYILVSGNPYTGRSISDDH